MRNKQTISDTKIKYIKIGDTEKLYSDVPEEEIFSISDFKEFQVTLKNKGVSTVSEIELSMKYNFHEWKCRNTN